ncbi:MAG: hypothetical protein IJD22_05515 [Clostridia bacterium]|nr:hypothetical protein [Clostridia bacterium]
MNTKEAPKNKKRIAAVDILIVILLLLCIAGIGVRIFIGEGNLFHKGDTGEYIVSYLISGEQDDYSSLFSEGCEFYLEDGSYFGTLTGNAAFTPALLSSENSRGEYVTVYATDGTVDIRGTMTVNGSMTESGFVLNSKTYISPNMTLTVSSSDITVKMLITDIAKAQ